MKPPLRPSSAAVVFSFAICMGLSIHPSANADPDEAAPEQREIEQLAVGNYWTMRERSYGSDGELDSEGYSSVLIVDRETISDKPCFKIKQFEHDRPRPNFSEARSINEGDNIYWEFLEDGNLHLFYPAEEDAPNKDTPALQPSVFDESNPALYLKYPAKPEELFQSFDTVATVIATDRVIKTPAGEFSCYVYGFLTDPTEPLPSKSYTLEYWCPGIGFIKLEEFEVTGAKKTLIFEMDLLAYHLEDNEQDPDTADPDDERRAKIENVR